MSGGHHHGHGHEHHPGHSHAPAGFGRAFVIGIGLNAGFVILETSAGLASGSLALLADAGHNLSDVAGLVVAYAAYLLSQAKPTRRFTYGYRGSSILAALFNALFLLVACGAIAWEAIGRFGAPPAVAGRTVIVVAAIGIVINAGTALLFARGRRGDMNIRGAYLHMAADAGVSAGVVLGGLMTLWTGARWIDPAIGLGIVAVILAGTWGLFREAVALSLQGVPAGIDPDAVRARLEALPGVARVHHLHIWATSTTQTAMTAHLMMPAGAPGDAFLQATAAMIADELHIGHATLQVEAGETCRGDC